MTAPLGGGLAGLPHYTLLTGDDLMERVDPEFLSTLLGLYGMGHEVEAKDEFAERLKRMVENKEIILRRHPNWTPSPTTEPSDEAQSQSVARPTLERLSRNFKDNGLPMATAHVERAMREDPALMTDTTGLPGWIKQLRIRIDDDFRYSLVLMRLSGEKSQYWDRARPFGEEAFTRFKEARLDATEAGNCYAAGRDTACVFHLMRVMEHVLRAVNGSLGLPDPTGGDRNWFNMLKAINDEMDVRDSRQGDPLTRDQAWVDNRPLYKKAHTQLGLVKNAWRDETMHVDAKHTAEEAHRIYNAVHTAMVELARLPEKI